MTNTIPNQASALRQDDVTPGFHTACTCTTVLSRRLNSVNHDFLAGIEAAGVGGAAELLQWVAWSIDDEPEETELPWRELPRFIAAHNWTDPAAMVRLADKAVEFGDALWRAEARP